MAITRRRDGPRRAGRRPRSRDDAAHVTVLGTNRSSGGMSLSSPLPHSPLPSMSYLILTRPITRHRHQRVSSTDLAILLLVAHQPARSFAHAPRLLPQMPRAGHAIRRRMRALRRRPRSPTLAEAPLDRTAPVRPRSRTRSTDPVWPGAARARDSRPLTRRPHEQYGPRRWGARSGASGGRHRLRHDPLVQRREPAVASAKVANGCRR